MPKKITTPKKRPGRKLGPPTTVHRVRFITADYNVIRTCWLKRNPRNFQSFHAWLLNEMHELAEACRKAGINPCE